MDLLALPVDAHGNLNGKKKVEFVKQLHEKACEHIEKRTEQYAAQANKGRKKEVFQPEDWVWVHMKNERFLAQRCSKFLPQEDGHFQVVAWTNEKGYQLDIFSRYNMSTTFNIFDISPFDVDDDSKMNPCEERGMMRTIKEI